jgi:hypothetical protein
VHFINSVYKIRDRVKNWKDATGVKCEIRDFKTSLDTVLIRKEPTTKSEEI